MKSRLVLVAFLALPGLAWAHHFMGSELPHTFAQGFLSGVGHPLIGPDHAAFILAVGFLLGAVPRGLLAVAALIAGTLAGAALHLAGIALPGAEAGIALSVILAGVALMLRPRISFAVLTSAIGLAGLLHGHAYAESIFGAEPMPLGAYLLGFSLVQLALAAGAALVYRRLLALRPLAANRLASALGVAAGAVGAVVLLAPLLAG